MATPLWSTAKKGTKNPRSEEKAVRVQFLRGPLLYFIEQMPGGRYVVRAKGAHEASGIFSTQQKLSTVSRSLNQGDHLDVERVRNVSTGGRDRWRTKAPQAGAIARSPV
jgi:hypothetical protein